MSEAVLVAREGTVAFVTINRPHVLNALNAQTLDQLRASMHELGDDAGVRAIILTGAGDKAFVAGADIGELAELSPARAQEHARTGQRTFNVIEHLGKPVIAAINGFALGGGCELAMACTLRLAAATAKIGQPEVNLGVLPGFAGTQRLARLVGKGIALELLLTGRPIPADEAYRIGLVNRVVPPERLLEEAGQLAAELAAKPRIATRFILDAVNRGSDGSFEQGTFLEATLFGLAFATSDMREGTRAFLEKRKPVFTGE